MILDQSSERTGRFRGMVEVCIVVVCSRAQGSFGIAIPCGDSELRSSHSKSSIVFIHFSSVLQVHHQSTQCSIPCDLLGPPASDPVFAAVAFFTTMAFWPFLARHSSSLFNFSKLAATSFDFAAFSFPFRSCFLFASGVPLGLFDGSLLQSGQMPGFVAVALPKTTLRAVSEKNATQKNRAHLGQASVPRRGAC